MRNFLFILVVSIPTVRLQSGPRPPQYIPVGRPTPLAESPIEDYPVAGYPDTSDNLLYDFPSERPPDYFVDGPPPVTRRRGRRRYSYPMTRSSPFDTYSRPPMFERYLVRPTRPPYARRRPIVDPYYEAVRPYDRMAFQPIFRGGFRRRLPPRYRPGVENYPHLNGEFEPIVHDRRGVPYTPRFSPRRLPPDFMDYRSSEFTRPPRYARRERFLSSGRKGMIFREQRRDRRGDIRLDGIGFPRQADYMQNKNEPLRETFTDAGFSKGSSYSGSGYRHQDYDFTSDYNSPRQSQLGSPGVGFTRKNTFPPDRPIRDPTSKRERLQPYPETDPMDRRNSLTRQQPRFASKTDHPRYVRSSHSPSDLVIKRTERSPLSPGSEINTETSNAINSLQDGFISESVNVKPAGKSDKIFSKSTSVNIKSSKNDSSRRSEINKINASQNDGSLENNNSSKSLSSVGQSTKEATKSIENQYNPSSVNINERQKQYFDIHNILTTPIDNSGENRYFNKKRKIGSANTFIKTTPHPIAIPVPLGFDLSKSSDMVVDLTKGIPENNQGQQMQTVQEISQITTPKVIVPAMNTNKRAPFESHTLSNGNRIPEIISKTSTTGPTNFKRGSNKSRWGRHHLRNGSTKEETRHRGQRRYRGSAASNNRETSSRPIKRQPHREVDIPRRDESSSSSTFHRDDLPYYDNFTRKDRPVKRPGRYLSTLDRLNREDRVSLSSRRPLRRPNEDAPVPSRSQRRRISSTVDKIPRRRILPSQRPYRPASSRNMSMENRGRPRQFRQYKNETSVGQTLVRPSHRTRLLRRPLSPRTYRDDYVISTDSTREVGLPLPRRIPQRTASIDRSSYDSLGERSRTGDFFQEPQLSPRRTRTDTQTIQSRQRSPPKEATSRRRLSSAERVPTGRRSDVEIQRHRRLPTRTSQENIPPERSRGSRESSLIESSHRDIMPPPRTRYIDEPILYPNDLSQVTGETSESPAYDILPVRNIRRSRRPPSDPRYRDESSIGLSTDRRRLPAPERSYPFEISEPSSSDRLDVRRDRIRSPRRPYIRLRRRPLGLRRRYLNESDLLPVREARREIPSTRRKPFSSERTSREYSLDSPPFTSRRRLQRPRESSRDSYPERSPGASRFRSFSSRDQYANESSIPPFPSVDLPQRRIASERRVSSLRRYDMEPQITDSGASLPDRRRIRVKSRRPRPLRYRVPRSEVTSLPPRRRRLPASRAIRNDPVSPPLAREETSFITAPFRKVAQVSLSVNETSSLPRVPKTEKNHRVLSPRRRHVLEQPSGKNRSYFEVRYKPPASQQVSAPSRYNDTIVGVRLGVVRARGGKNGFPIHGGFCPGERCADGGLAAGVENGTGTGTLDAFLERRRTGANEDIIAYKRELGSLTII